MTTGCVQCDVLFGEMRDRERKRKKKNEEEEENDEGEFLCTQLLGFFLSFDFFSSSLCLIHSQKKKEKKNHRMAIMMDRSFIRLLMIEGYSSFFSLMQLCCTHLLELFRSMIKYKGSLFASPYRSSDQ